MIAVTSSCHHYPPVACSPLRWRGRRQQREVFADEQGDRRKSESREALLRTLPVGLPNKFSHLFDRIVFMFCFYVHFARCFSTSPFMFRVVFSAAALSLKLVWAPWSPLPVFQACALLVSLAALSTNYTKFIGKT